MMILLASTGNYTFGYYAFLLLRKKGSKESALKADIALRAILLITEL
jgi:hypothetical protein